MRILLTGASSFTGYWFAKELYSAGHLVTAVFQSKQEDYFGIRKRRVDELLQFCNGVFDCPFGSFKFLDQVNAESSWDLLCHHAADVTNYKSQEFDVGRAVSRNTHNIKDVFDALEKRDCRKIVITGSVFEQNEGAGSDLWKAFSPYGLSKSFTADIFRYHANLRSFKLGKFVIPNPFGPYEEPRFTSYLIKNWAEGKTPSINTPAYVRDNIHVDLLAKCYRYFAESLKGSCPRYERLNPSGYIGSQGDFTERFSKEMATRLNLACEIDLKKQTVFEEPMIRVNVDIACELPVIWNEKEAWDNLALYYESIFNVSSASLV